MFHCCKNVKINKDYWPVNEPAVCTITSSIQKGLNLGYSFKNGFSLDGISISEVRLILNYKFVVDKSFSSAKTSTGTADLFVRAGEYKDIYGFCNGMV